MRGNGIICYSVFSYGLRDSLRVDGPVSFKSRYILFVLFSLMVLSSCINWICFRPEKWMCVTFRNVNQMYRNITKCLFAPYLDNGGHFYLFFLQGYKHISGSSSHCPLLGKIPSTCYNYIKSCRCCLIFGSNGVESLNSLFIFCPFQLPDEKF